MTIDKLRREFDRKKRATEFVKNSPLDIADRIIAALEAELERVREEREQNGRDYCDLMEKHDAEFVRAEQAEAEVALRDRMLELAAESLVRASGRYRPEEEMAKLPEEHMREQRDKTLTHLRARAQEAER